jgi:5-methyltetrahydrofolate--homocysteine methyltransferase
MIIIGEKINGAIPAVAEAIAKKDAAFIRDLAVTQAEAWANYIDVCASVDVAVELETLKWLIDIVQEATETPIAVDSPDATICAKAIELCNKPGLEIGRAHV